MESPDNEGFTSLKNAETTLCIDFGIQTTTKTTETATQTEEDSPASTALVTSPANDATSSPAQPPSTTATTMTTATTAAAPASKRPPASQQRRHTLPERTTGPQQRSQPLPMSPEPRRYTATSQWPVMMKFVGSTLE